MSPEHDIGKAEASFERSLSVARQQQAKSWELRAAMSLARLWRDRGKVREARELLAPVYGWFTEGFGTRDLKEAKILLEELAVPHSVDSQIFPNCIAVRLESQTSSLRHCDSTAFWGERAVVNLGFEIETPPFNPIESVVPSAEVTCTAARRPGPS
jgi:hypothetical protein